MTSRPLISARETALRLGMSLDLFYRKRKAFERELGFPREVLPGRWCPDALDAWVRMRSGIDDAAAAANDDAARTAELAREGAARVARAAGRGRN